MMDSRKVELILSLLKELSKEEFTAVAHEVSQGLRARGIVRDKSHPLGTRYLMKY